MLQLVAPPAEPDRFWEAPPSFEDTPEFKFDLRPDCSYWLSLEGFNPDYAGEIISAVYVDRDWITCPYFTIEFKKAGESNDRAKLKACAAASVALYNRYLLKCGAVVIGKQKWPDSDIEQVKHYIMTFGGHEYRIFVLRANFASGSNEWDGCTATPICHATCTSMAGIRRLQNWINEIHRWGLSKHATGCHADVKTILEAGNYDVSGMDLEVDEIDVNMRRHRPPVPCDQEHVKRSREIPDAHCA